MWSENVSHALHFLIKPKGKAAQIERLYVIKPKGKAAQIERLYVKVVFA